MIHLTIQQVTITSVMVKLIQATSVRVIFLKKKILLKYFLLHTFCHNLWLIFSLRDFDGRWPLMADNLKWKTNLGGKCSSVMKGETKSFNYISEHLVGHKPLYQNFNVALLIAQPLKIVHNGFFIQHFHIDLIFQQKKICSYICLLVLEILKKFSGVQILKFTFTFFTSVR